MIEGWNLPVLRAKVPATTANLGPGFDALGMALSLHNELEVRPTCHQSLAVIVKGEGAGSLPRDRSNLVALTFAGYFESRGLTPPPVELSCLNRIPLARGLGSSAAAIVGALAVADTLAGMLGVDKLGRDALFRMAVDREGHPDNVGAALFGGLVVVSSSPGRDDNPPELLYHRLPPPQGLHAVVAIPPYEVTTAAARAVLPQEVTHAEAVFNVSRVALLVAALASGDLGHLAAAMEDRLHQPYREELVPGFSQAVTLARRAGALGVALSGSGSSVIALTDSLSAVGPVSEALRASLSSTAGEPRVLDLVPEVRGCMVSLAPLGRPRL